MTLEDKSIKKEVKIKQKVFPFMHCYTHGL